MKIRVSRPGFYIYLLGICRLFLLYFACTLCDFACLVGFVTFPFLRFFDSVSATVWCSFYSESFLTGDFSVPGLNDISIDYLSFIMDFLATFLSLCFNFLSTFVLFLELFSPSMGLNYIPLYLCKVSGQTVKCLEMRAKKRSVQKVNEIFHRILTYI